MPNVISDSSALIALDNIEMIFVLKELYGKIYITNEVHHEFGKNIENLIDLGESSTIALALETSDSLIILEDLKARQIAKRLNLRLTGLLGVILRAKQREIIPSVSKVLNKLEAVYFRISVAMKYARV